MDTALTPQEKELLEILGFLGIPWEEAKGMFSAVTQTGITDEFIEAVRQRKITTRIGAWKMIIRTTEQTQKPTIDSHS